MMSSIQPAVIVVSGLPRSGTSLMMQMLDQGGIEVVTDRIRTPDADNPRGYYEFEPAKRLKHDASWLPSTRGKAVKLVSQLLYDLPGSETYRIIFMERDLDETLLSQEKMLARLGRRAVPREQMKRSYELHLERLRVWLDLQPTMELLTVCYQELVHNPHSEARRVNDFLAAQADVERMAQSVDPCLYRNRKS
jgi:hypothetical protein